MNRVGILLIFSLFLLPSTLHASVVNRSATTFTNGLVGYWTFDGKDITNGRLNDLSGNGQSIYPISIASSTFYSVGKTGQAITLDGIDDFVQIAPHNVALPTALKFGTGPFTISFWYKGPNNSDWNGDYLIGATRTSGWNVQRNSAGVVRFGTTDGVGADLITASVNIYDDKWHHVVSYRDGTNVNMYIDGVAQTPITDHQYDTDTSALLQAIRIGSGAGASPGNFHGGTMDSLRFYNRALSASEVQALYALGAPSIANRTATSRITSSLAAHWTFDGPSILQNIADVSGNSRHGSMVGFTSTSSAVTLGANGQALKFDGIDDQVKILSVPTVTQPYSVSFWFKTTFPATSRHIITFGTGNPTPTIFLTGIRQIEIDGASSGSFRAFCNTTFNATTDANKWIHVVVVVNSSTDASQWKCFVNGADIGVSNSNSTGTYSDPPATNWTIGNYPALSLRFYSGSLDDVRVFSRALTQADVTTLYNQGSGSTVNKNTNTRSTTGLVGLWSFDGPDMLTNVRDKSGSGNTGYMLNFAATSSAQALGKIGQALNFDGVDDQINAGSASSLDDLGPLTYSVWINPTSVGTGTLGGGEMLDKQRRVFYISNIVAPGKPIVAAFLTSNATTNTNVYCDIAISPNKWTHVAVTWDGTVPFTGSFYLNGAACPPSGTLGSGATLSDAAVSQFIGSRFDSTSFFPGKMDDVRIYNRVLSAGEIASLYNLGR